MRKPILLTILAFTGLTAGAGYITYNDDLNPFLAGTDLEPAEASANRQHDNINAESLPQLQALAELVRDNGQFNREQVARLRDSNEQTINILLELESRLRNLENNASPANNNDEQETVASQSGEGGQGQQFSEANMGQWLEQAIIVKAANAIPATRILSAAQRNLEKLPDTNLDDLKCGDGFCRATLSHVAGEEPEYTKLLGEPPFVNEVFSLIQPDGRVLLYFNQPGESMADLRLQAQAETLQ